MECVNNLYKSVQGLDNIWFVDKKRPGNYESSISKTLSLNPGIAPTCSCSDEKFTFCLGKNKEMDGMTINKEGEVRPLNFDSDRYFLQERVVILPITNPKKGENSERGFVKRPAMFIVSDSLVKRPAIFIASYSLVIKPCNNTTSSISFLKGLNVPFDDIEEHTKKITKQEVLSILKASLAINSAFTSVLGILSKKRK